MAANTTIGVSSRGDGLWCHSCQVAVDKPAEHTLSHEHNTAVNEHVKRLNAKKPRTNAEREQLRTEEEIALRQLLAELEILKE